VLSVACSCPFLIQLVVLVDLVADSLRSLRVFVFAVSPSSCGLDVAVYVLAGLMGVFMDGCVRCRHRVLRCLGLWYVFYWFYSSEVRGLQIWTLLQWLSFINP